MPEWFNEFQEFFYWTARLPLFVATAGFLASALSLGVVIALEAIFTKPIEE